MALNPRKTSLFQAQQRGDRAAGSQNPGSSGKAKFFEGSFFKAQAFSQGVGLIEDGVSGLANFEAAKDQFKNSLEAAKQFEFNAKQEEIKGRQIGANTAAEVNQIQASNFVRAFASGIQASGSVTRAQEIIGEKGARNITFARTDAAIRAGALRRAKKLKEDQARYDLEIARYNKRIAPLKMIAGIGLSAFAVS